MNNQSPYARSNQPGASGPSPKASLAGLVAAAVAVAMVAVAVVVALVLTLGDDGSDDPKADETSQSTDSPTTDDPTTDDPTETPTPDANTIVGSGYAYQLPGGWSDVSDEVGNTGPNKAIDTVAAWGSQFQGSRANFIVNTTTAGASTTPEDLAKEWTASLVKELGTQPEDVAGITVDGQETVGVRFERKNENDVEIVQIAYLAINDGKAYTLGLSTTPAQEADTQDAFDEIVDSWAWN
ncbi:hypothetical protein ASG90_04710 [Nocardioides sp. Soil797]|nr:hypothetical protein ASG90_04710 [Nocardioides sp. Soil797]